MSLSDSLCDISVVWTLLSLVFTPRLFIDGFFGGLERATDRWTRLLFIPELVFLAPIVLQQALNRVPKITGA